MKQNQTEVLGPKEWEARREEREPSTAVDASLYQAVDKLLDPKYEPQLVAKGGEHLVFELRDPQWPRNVVVKVNFRESLPVYKAYDKGNKERIEMEKNRLESRMTNFNRKKALLKKYFGSSAVPAQMTMIRNIPMNPEIAGKLSQAVFTDTRTIMVPAWISVQRRIDLDSEKTFSLSGYYLESVEREIDPVLYEEAHAVLALGDDQDFKLDDQLEIALEAMPELEELPAQIEFDQQFKTALQETARKLIRFVQETGEVLDLAGNNNIVLVQGKGGWQLKLPDVLFNDDMSLDVLKGAVEAIRRGEVLKYDSALRCYCAMNTIRVVNALAIISGIPERLRIPELQVTDSNTWWKIFKQVRF